MEYVSIELNGLPGCGKTTLVNSLDTGIIKYFSLENSFFSCLNKPLGRFCSLKFCFFGNILFDIKFIFYVQKHAVCGKKKHALQKVLKLFRFKGILKQNKNNFLLSEGYLQIVLEIMDFLDVKNFQATDIFYEYVKNDLKNLTNLYFVLIKIPVSVAEQRISTRNSPLNTVDLMNPFERQGFLHKRFVNTEYLQNIVQKLILPNRLLLIDGEASVEFKCSLLTTFLLTTINRDNK